jgi:nitrite reductase/ring-hydroxylating ferredoxin subunit
MLMRYYSLEKYINLFDGYRKVFKIDSHHLMLLQLDGDRYLIESNCPHREYPLSSSDLEGMELVCPQHGYRFDIQSGALKHFSEEPCRNLLCFDLVDRDNEVGVMLEY